MQFLKNFFNHDNVIIGLNGIRKQKDYIKISIPENLKKTHLTNICANYLLP